MDELDSFAITLLQRAKGDILSTESVKDGMPSLAEQIKAFDAVSGYLETRNKIAPEGAKKESAIANLRKRNGSGDQQRGSAADAPEAESGEGASGASSATVSPIRAA